jgi:hypothetical protein
MTPLFHHDSHQPPSRRIGRASTMGALNPALVPFVVLQADAEGVANGVPPHPGALRPDA